MFIPKYIKVVRAGWANQRFAVIHDEADRFSRIRVGELYDKFTETATNPDVGYSTNVG